MNWIKSHPYVAGGIVIVGGLLLYALMRGSGGSAGVGNEPLQIANLNASAAIQQAQIGAQAQTAQAQTQAQVAQVQAQLSANEENAISGLLTSAITGQQGSQVASQQIEAELLAEQGQTSLAATENASQMQLALQAMAAPNAATAVNELSVIEGQGGVGSYNAMEAALSQYAAQESLAKINAESSIAGGLLKTLTLGLF